MNPTPQSLSLANAILAEWQFHYPVGVKQINATPESLAHVLDNNGVRKLVEALEVTKREVECYCTHEGISAGQKGFPCAHCMAVAALATEPSGAKGERRTNPLEITPRDWTEDFNHENGNYTCTCHLCQQTFVGHKRRMVCKVCAELPAIGPDPSADVNMRFGDSLPPEPRADNEATPETDREERVCEDKYSNLYPNTNGKAVRSSFARTLERQRNAAIAERDGWERNWQAQTELVADLRDELSTLKAQGK